MRTFFLMLNGGQEASIEIEAWDMGDAIDRANARIREGWDIGWIRNECQEDFYPRLNW